MVSLLLYAWMRRIGRQDRQAGRQAGRTGRGERTRKKKSPCVRSRSQEMNKIKICHCNLLVLTVKFLAVLGLLGRRGLNADGIIQEEWWVLDAGRQAGRQAGEDASPAHRRP